MTSKPSLKAVILMTICFGISKFAYGDSYPIFIETDAGQAQGLVIHNNGDLNEYKSIWDIVFTVGHIVDGTNLISTNTKGVRTPFNILSVLEEIDIAVAGVSKKPGGGLGTSRGNRLTIEAFVPERGIQKMIGQTVYGERISSRAGGLESIQFRVKSVKDNNVY